jgi:rRNA biogenesis protein RRP5
VRTQPQQHNPHACGRTQGAKRNKAKAAKKVHLSLCLADVCAGMDASSFPLGAMVPALVRTVEENGCVCLTGVPAVSAFLPHAEFAAACGPGTRPVPGQIVQAVVVQRLRDGASVTLDCAAAGIAGATTREFHGVTLRSLLPGQHVTVTVRHVLSDGLLVSFLKFFHGTVDLFHLPHDAAASWRTAFQPGTRVPARILYVDPASKQVRCHARWMFGT